MKWIEEHLTGFMIIVLILIFAIWFFSAPILFYLFGSPLSVGEAGDIFGAIGALFSGLAFWGSLTSAHRAKASARRAESHS